MTKKTYLQGPELSKNHYEQTHVLFKKMSSNIFPTILLKSNYYKCIIQFNT